MIKNIFILLSLLLLSCNNEESDLLETSPPNQNISMDFSIPEIALPKALKVKKKLNNGRSIEVYNGYNIIDGDILLTDEQVEIMNKKESSLRSAIINNQNFKWPNGIIPYTIDYNHPCSLEIERAIAEWSSKTSIRFIRHTNSPTGSYLRFLDGNIDGMGNASYVGKRYPGEQKIWVANKSKGIAMHEIGHAIGLIHEHQRSDALSYIVIYKEKIKEGWEEWYLPHTDSHDCLYPFDFKSIMNYGSDYCSKTGYPMTKKNGGIWYANREYATIYDISAARKLYDNVSLLQKLSRGSEKNITIKYPNKVKINHDFVITVELLYSRNIDLNPSVTYTWDNRQIPLTKLDMGLSNTIVLEAIVSYNTTGTKTFSISDNSNSPSSYILEIQVIN